VHGDNLAAKENHGTKYRDETSRQYLREIRERYDGWHEANMALEGPGKEVTDEATRLIEERVRLLAEYKDFIDQQKYAEHFDSRSNLHSSVLEEFMYYLFKDLVKAFTPQALVGKGNGTFKDMFFVHRNYSEMVHRPGVQIETKDHDFVIGTTIDATLRCVAGSDDEVETVSLHLPAVAIECKTYLDKSMLEASSNAAEQLKARNPNGLYIVVMEWIKLAEQVNLRKYKVDQIYVLRKQRNTDREFRYLDSYIKNPIDPGVVKHLFQYVRSHLTAEWVGGVNYGIERGYLL